MPPSRFQRVAIGVLVILLAAVAAVRLSHAAQGFFEGLHDRFAHRHEHDFDHDLDHDFDVDVDVDLEEDLAMEGIAPPPPPPPPPPPLPPMPPLPPSLPEEARREIEAAHREATEEARRAVEEAHREMEEARREVERERRRAPRAQVMGLTLAPVAATSVSRSTRDEVLYERRFRVRAGDVLRVALSSEDVIVEPTRGNEASVTVRGRGRDARSEFERRRFEASYGGGVLHVRTQQRNSRPSVRPRNVEAAYTVVIRIPEEFDAELGTASGDLRLDRLHGEATISTASGDLAIGVIHGGPVSISTASGDVSAERLDNVRSISTASGDLAVSHLGGREVNISTASGDVSLGTVDVARFEASTASGDVSAEFRRGAPIEVSTASGDVSLSLPRGTGADVSLSGGSIDLDRALAFRGTQNRRGASGRLGGGGPDVSVSTSSGSISLMAN